MPRYLGRLRADAESIFRIALQAVDARAAVSRHLRFDSSAQSLLVGPSVELPLASFDRAFVIGGGKAAAPMAASVEEVIGDKLALRGVVNVKYGHTFPRPRVICLNECAHPAPDSAGVAGVQMMESVLDELTERDLLFVLISGGASALLPAPADGITLTDKQEITASLLRAGANIEELNAVRKHLSSLKGGQLVRRAGGAMVVTLLLSDVLGDRPDVIGSGPTVPDPSTFQDALHVVVKYSLLGSAPASVVQRLKEGARGGIPDTPKSNADLSGRVHNVIIGSNRLAIESAREHARELGYKTLILSSSLQGESREVAKVHAEILREVMASGNPVECPACLLSGGETTVTVRGPGKGGRNQEFALSAAIAIANLDGAVILAAGTDGTDGPTDAAGAIIDGTTFARASTLGLSPAHHLAQNDSYPLLHGTGDLLMIGPTGTNVMDFNIMLADIPVTFL